MNPLKLLQLIFGGIFEKTVKGKQKLNTQQFNTAILLIVLYLSCVNYQRITAVEQQFVSMRHAMFYKLNISLEQEQTKIEPSNKVVLNKKEKQDENQE